MRRLAILTTLAEIVRTAIGSDARLPKRRTLEERLMVRWPGGYVAMARAVSRLPPRSRDAPQEWLIAGMPSVYRGQAGLREWFAELREAWEILDHTSLELVDSGDVFAFLCRSGCVPGQVVSSWTRSSDKSFGWSEAWSCESTISPIGAKR